ncbi:MAG: PaaI family thioesterase [Brevundimonas aurantiaca]|uniref:PaaI family thioesterase n=1 Tax=Brevundimonas aurantiaca TaxID=74316 RepID=UPI004033547B
MNELLDRLPYARFLNLQTQMNGDEVTVVMPFADQLIGNPMLPALHGGSTAALLEMTAMAQIALAFPSSRLPRPINVTVAYLRTGHPVDVFARAEISRAGRRIAHVQAEAWQESRSRPIASLTAHFLLEES